MNAGGDLRRDWGVDAETVAVGENAAAMLPFTGLTAKQEQIVNDLTDHVYHGFLEKASPCLHSKSSRKLHEDVNYDNFS